MQINPYQYLFQIKRRYPRKYLVRYPNIFYDTTCVKESMENCVKVMKKYRSAKQTEHPTIPSRMYAMELLEKPSK